MYFFQDVTDYIIFINDINIRVIPMKYYILSEKYENKL